MDKPQSNVTNSAVPEFDEQRLVQRLRDGEESAFRELVQTFRRPVYGYMIRCGLDSATCDDLFQQVFVNVQHGLATFRSDRPLKPWLFTIVANCVRSHFRRERVRELVYADEVLEADPAPSAGDCLEAQETADFLARALLSLPFVEREVVALVCVEQVPLADAAQALRVPLSTVKTRLRRARQGLAEMLARRQVRTRREACR